MTTSEQPDAKPDSVRFAEALMSDPDTTRPDVSHPAEPMPDFKGMGSGAEADIEGASGPEAEAAQGQAGAKRSVIDTWVAVLADASGLLRSEAILVRRETGDNLTKMAGQLGMIGAGVLFVSLCAIFAAVAAVVALGLFIGTLWALLLVAVLCGLLGYGLLKVGTRRIARQSVLPHRSIARLRKDLLWVEEHGPPLPRESGPEGVRGENAGDFSKP